MEAIPLPRFSNTSYYGNMPNCLFSEDFKCLVYSGNMSESRVFPGCALKELVKCEKHSENTFLGR